MESANYRLVDNYKAASTIPFGGNVLKCGVAKQLQGVLEEAHFLDPSQSGYGMAMVLIAMVKKLARTCNSGTASLLIFLNLSAPFDPIDHGRRLEHLTEVGVGGMVLRWLSSFASERSQEMVAGSSVPLLRTLPVGL